jgi:hypothetical protein
MGKALEIYSTALAQAKEIETDGVLVVDQAGGSSHGGIELFYRVHASRLKCLIFAVSQQEYEIEMAEEEALRLTEGHWFKKPSDDQKVEDLPTRDRVWNVLTDVVTVLAQCKIDHPFFHRSVYRHAQALMWAPVLHDPVGGRAEGRYETKLVLCVAADDSFYVSG